MAQDINVTISETDTISVTITGGIGINAVSIYKKAFTDSDLAAGILTVTHNLAVTYPIIQIYNNNEKQVTPDDVTYVDSNSCLIDLSSWGTISGTWNVSILGGT